MFNLNLGSTVRQWTFRFLPAEPKNGVPKFDLAPNNGLSAVVTYPGLVGYTYPVKQTTRCPS